MNSVTKPLSYNKPVEKICQDLKKKDGEICSLRYGLFYFQFYLEITICKYHIAVLCMFDSRVSQVFNYIHNHQANVK